MRMTIRSQASAGGPSRRTRLSGRTAGQAGRAADRLAADAWLPGCLLVDVIFMRSPMEIMVVMIGLLRVQLHLGEPCGGTSTP